MRFANDGAVYNFNAKNQTLSDLKGNFIVASKDQYGSRLIQEKYESATDEERETIFKEILPESLTLMRDVFGNYVI